MDWFTYDEGMLQLLEDLLLVLDVVHVLAVNDFLLLHCLDRELVVRIVFQPCQLHISESA